MADDTTTATTQVDNGNSGSDLLRKIVAVIVGLIVIILIVLLAKWLGDQIRDRFFNTTPAVVTTTDGTIISTPSANPRRTATYSAIPSTGPNDAGYALLAFLAVSGLSTLALSRKFVR